MATGAPILAEEALEGVCPLPCRLVGEGEPFALKVMGASVIDAAIREGASAK
ncbi:hypothetical protein [Streptomyces sp. NPDC005181]|uniref:LexA family protein n=1 Tax=Streptomyces sp. NPDC005181 TaxID=3156869 RepID=UPI0033B4CC79